VLGVCDVFFSGKVGAFGQKIKASARAFFAIFTWEVLDNEQADNSNNTFLLASADQNKKS